MIRSTNQKLGEYDLIRRPEHFSRVWATVEASLPDYWNRFLDSERGENPAGKLIAKFGGASSQGKETDGAVVARIFDKAQEAYEKEGEKYRFFFEAEALEEFQDDPNAFKQALSRDVPVIARTLRNRRAELKEWQIHFRGARSNDLLEVFCNVLDFVEGWSESHPPEQYADYDSPEAFGLDPLDDDSSMYMENVVGMGIKSLVLYHLDPQRLPARGRYGLYGLYFLSQRKPFDLPSGSSEFLMVNDVDRVSDGSMIMDQNYWYPYGLFSLYALRIFRWMSDQTAQYGIKLDPSIRFVFVERFFEAVCAQHAADLKTMRAHERFEVPA